MSTNAPGGSATRSLLRLAVCSSPMLAALGLMYLAFPAQSQINGRVTSPSFSEASHPAASNDSDGDGETVTPKAPVQAELPPAPPTRYVPGMEEALIATGPVSEAESKDLDAALAQFHDAPAKTPGGDYDDYAKPLLAFISAHPDSHWNAALYLDLGLGYYHAGYYSRTFGYFEKAWQLGRNAQGPQISLLIDRAVGELAEMHARLGHADELKVLLKDVGDRRMGGIGAQRLQGAREGLGVFEYDPGRAYLCGPKALRNLLKATGGTAKQLEVVDKAKSGKHGFSLTELAALADKAKIKYTLIHRDAGDAIPVPSIMNENVHHYAAITETRNGYYRVVDPTFEVGDGTMLTGRAIDEEGSGYFLVPTATMKAQPKNHWRVVSASSKEAQAVYGMGTINVTSVYWTTGETQSNNGCPSGMSDGANNSQGGCDGSNQGFTPPNGRNGTPRILGGSPMAKADVLTNAVSLRISDTPVGYVPQVGVPAKTSITYNQREAVMPASPSFSNLGSNWSHSWIGMVIDDPVHPGSNVMAVYGGGGGRPEVNHNGTTGAYTQESYDSTQFYQVPANSTATSYTRYMPDGSTETYDLSNGAASYPRLMFLTKVTDPQGNVTTINYDSTFRITTIKDAVGRNTTFSYTQTGQPLLITKIADPFGRFTAITYDPTSLMVSSITDPIGITSSFTYSTTTGDTTFITQMTTPYGNTTFSDTVNPHDSGTPSTSTRSLTSTDPLGFTDYAYFYQNNSLPNADPVVPSASGFSTNNTLMQWRNTFYWNKHQVPIVFPGGINTAATTNAQFGQAYTSHWLHDQGNFPNLMSRNAESVKAPLENRVWYNYPSQPQSIENGSIDLSSAIARVQDDTTSQLAWATYNGYGLPLTIKDPIGRTTQYTYDNSHSTAQLNGLDLLTVAQLTALPSTYTTIATFSNYNAQHEAQTFVGPDGQTWKYTYNSFGQIATVTDPNTGLTTYNYNTGGTGAAKYQLLSITDANNQPAVTFTYDSANRIHTRMDSQGYVLTYAYDKLDRITSITYPDGTHDTYNYNFQSGPLAGTPSLELRKHTDRLSRVTTYNYDADQRLTSVVEPTSGSATRTTQYQYYEDGTLEDIIDANGNDTHWAIDLESRPTSKTYGFGGTSPQTENYAYETSTSRLHSITDALSQVKTFAYAGDDRITGITYTATVNPTPNVTFAWDPFFPRLSSMTDGTGTTNYSYTAIGTLGALKPSSINGPYTNDTIGLTYDALGRLGGRTITGGNETFGYDAISRMNSHVTPLGSFTYTYQDETDKPLSRSVTNGSTTVSTNWGYETATTSDFRLISITNSGVTRSYTLSYLNGATNNPYGIMGITDTAASGHPWATQSRAYTYDKIDRLLTASSTTPGNDTYAYDKLDNATTVTTPSGTVTPAPTYNGFNQIKTWGSLTYSYDNDGNLLSGDGVHTYKWDAENRLIEIDYVGTSNKSVFTYDGLGHRISDAETVSGTTTTTYYLWCGSSICQTRNSSQTAIRRDLDEGEFNVSSSQKLVYMPDQLGSVRDVLDATTGNLIDSADYTPYGATARVNGTTPMDYQFAGLFAHTQSGLNLSATRAQDGVTGRWLGKDFVRESGGINLYEYVDANPITHIDPAGLDCMSANGDTTCHYFGGPVFNVPTPSGFPPFLGPDSWGNILRYHTYDVSRSIGCADPQLVMQNIINNPTPGASLPASPTGQRNNAAILGFGNNLVTSYLTSDSNTGAPVVVNITDGNSAFNPGYVAFTISNGTLHAYGEGLSAWQTAANPFQNNIANMVWGPRLSRAIANAGCGGCE